MVEEIEVIYIYELDDKNIYTGNFKEYDPKQGRKPNWVRHVPPSLTGTQVAIWDGAKYFIRETYPVPPIVVPTKISMRQARTVLLNHDLLASTETIIDNIEDVTLKAKVKIDWEYATEIWRNWEWISLVGDELSLTSQDIDNLFIEASTL
jgi:hypothetical protein